MLENKPEDEPHQTLRHFFQRYGTIYKIAQRAQQDIDRFAARDFSVFKLFNYDEMVLSKIIANLLSPQGTHGQGTLFLELFIQRINDELLPNKDDKLDMTLLEKTAVETEVVTRHIERSQRRIDIVLANPPHWVLGIENKPWASNQEKQLEAYKEELNRNHRYAETARRHVMYISGSCSQYPSDDPKLAPLYFGYNANEQHCGKGHTHAHLIDWLAECAQKCQADKVRHFLVDFTQWIQSRREFTNQQLYDNEI